MNQTAFDPVAAAPHFDACITKVGSFANAARLMGLKTAWGVQKWRSDGVPADRVIAFCAVSEWVSRPHDLRPDVYPNPTDGRPGELRGKAAA